jgi:hypothetical protein
MSTEEIGAARWATLLTEHFFGGEYAGTHVLFYVDRPVLAELAGRGEEEAAASLVTAILPQLRLRSHRELFGPLLALSTRWKIDGGEGPPPCLPALGLAVLAASEMRREAGRSGANYHAWFHDLISIGVPDIDAHDLWESYADAYPTLWRYLTWWLDERHVGELGLSTVAEGSRSKLGFADSQTIFVSSDRDKLSQFLHWAGVVPGEEREEVDLLGHFRIWSANRDDLSPGASLMLAEGGGEQRQLGHLLAYAARRWKGEVRDDEGRAQARLALTLSRPPRPRLGLVAPAPPGFPAQLDLRIDGEEVRLEATDMDQPLAPDESHWYGALPVEVTEGVLGSGIRLEGEGRVLRLAPRSVYVLHMSRELGCWTSVEHIRPGEPAWLLTSARHLEEVRSILERVARPGWSPFEREGSVPAGWALLRDVVIDRAPDDVGPIATALRPRTSNLLELSGGLPMPRAHRVYLTGGDPDVILPAQEEGAPLLEVELDGESLDPGPGQVAIPLAPLTPPEGRHLVRVGPLERKYATVRSRGVVTPAVSRPIGHAIEAAGASGWGATSLDATSEPELPPDGVRILGATVEHGADAAVEEERRRLILPRGALRRILLSEEPGVMEVVEVPEEPPWMREAGLACQCFEHAPAIDAAWLVTDWRMRGTAVRRLDHIPGAPSTPEADLLGWSEVVLGAPLEAAAEEERRDWGLMREWAEGLV